MGIGEIFFSPENEFLLFLPIFGAAKIESLGLISILIFQESAKGPFPSALNIMYGVWSGKV